MRRLIIILLLFSGTATFGQKLNFIQVDTATYNQYLRGDWEQLIETGKNAMENNIDYYYLQMRIAYACFSLEKYREAIQYYKNALAFSSKDPVANEYLYYAYKYSGRQHDALVQTSRLTYPQKVSIGFDEMKKFVSFGIGYASSFSDIESVKQQVIDQSGTILTDGVQKATYSLNSPQVTFSHRFGKKVIANHSGSTIFKNELSYVIINGTEYLSPEQPVRQNEYNLGLDIRAAEGLLIKPAVHYLSTSIPLYDITSYGPGAGRDRYVYSTTTITKLVPKIEIEKQMTHFDLGFSYLYHTFNEIRTHQAAIHTTIYPMANLNLYFSVDGYMQFFTYNNDNKRSIVVKPVAGYRLHKNFWMEISGTFPEQFSFYDVKNSIAFNNIESTSHTLNIQGIIPLYKKGAKIFAGYHYRNQNSAFYQADKIFEPINNYSYTSHLITGGIKWTK